MQRAFGRSGGSAWDKSRPMIEHALQKLCTSCRGPQLRAGPCLACQTLLGQCQSSRQVAPRCLELSGDLPSDLRPPVLVAEDLLLQAASFHPVCLV